MKNSKSVSITGHRPHKLPWGQNESGEHFDAFRYVLYKEVESLIKEGYTKFYSGMSWGIDLIFGEIVLDHKKKTKADIELIAVIAHKEQHVKWNVSYQERYFNLLAKCDEVVLISYQYTQDCFKKQNKFLVSNSYCLIAILDNNIKNSGTQQTLNMAKSRSRYIVQFDPDAFVMDRYYTESKFHII